MSVHNNPVSRWAPSSLQAPRPASFVLDQLTSGAVSPRLRTTGSSRGRYLSGLRISGQLEPPPRRTRPGGQIKFLAEIINLSDPIAAI